jgi:hypothetical protein
VDGLLRPDPSPGVSDSDALGDAIGNAVTDAIDAAHFDAIFSAEPRHDALGNPCPVCDADRYRRADRYADDDPTADTRY